MNAGEKTIQWLFEEQLGVDRPQKYNALMNHAGERTRDSKDCCLLIVKAA